MQRNGEPLESSLSLILKTSNITGIIYDPRIVPFLEQPIIMRVFTTIKPPVKRECAYLLYQILTHKASVSTR
jgi:hypothetical protein